MIKKIIFFLLFLTFTQKAFSVEVSLGREFKCEDNSEIPNEEVLILFGLNAYLDNKDNVEYIIQELKKEEINNDLVCEANKSLTLKLNTSILDNVPFPIEVKSDDKKGSNLVIKTEDNENENENTDTNQNKKKQENEKKKQEQIILETQKLDNGIIVENFIENEISNSSNQELFSPVTIEDLSKKYVDYKNRLDEINNLEKQQLEILKTDFKSIQLKLLNEYFPIIKSYNDVIIFCKEIENFKFEERKDDGKNLNKNCDEFTDWSSNSSFNYIILGNKNFKDYFNLEVTEIYKQINNNIRIINKKIETINKKKEEEEKRKKAEQKRQEEEKQKKLEQKKKELEEKRRKEEEEKRREEELKKEAEDKKRKQEEEYDDFEKLIKEIEIQKLNENYKKLADKYKELSEKDKLSINIDDDLENFNKDRDELDNDNIFIKIKEVKNNIRLNELLDEDQKENLLENINNNVEGKIENRKDEIDTYIENIEGKLNSQDQAFRSKIDELENRNTLYLFIIIGTIVILGGAIIYLILRRSKDDVPSQTSSIRNTSILQQEIDELKQIIRNSQQQSNVQQTPNVTQQQPQDEVRQPTEEELFTQKLNDLGHDYLEAITDPNKIEGFKEKWQAIGLDRESRVGASTVTTLKKDNRPFERCNFWAVPIRNSYRIFGGRILRTNSVALTADDGRMARDLLTGIFDIEYGTSFQIRQQGVAVMKNQIFEITTKGKITIPKT